MTDLNDGGGAITEIPQSTVFANNLLIAVKDSRGTSHFPCPTVPIHCYPNWVTTESDHSVYINNIKVTVEGDTDSCGHIRINGSPTVFVG